jgi:hypothetical protein
MTDRTNTYLTVSTFIFVGLLVIVSTMSIFRVQQINDNTQRLLELKNEQTSVRQRVLEAEEKQEKALGVMLNNQNVILKNQSAIQSELDKLQNK